MTVILECSDGDLVTEILIPRTPTMPGVIEWNDRVFQFFNGITYREIEYPDPGKLN